jgi:hypothetical protein
MFAPRLHLVQWMGQLYGPRTGPLRKRGQHPAAGACAAGRSSVTLSVTGRAGTVTSSPSGLNVSSGNTGSACFANNNRVELTASRSVTWSGVSCDGGNTQTRCRFNLGTAPVSLTATLR